MNSVGDAWAMTATGILFGDLSISLFCTALMACEVTFCSLMYLTMALLNLFLPSLVVNHWTGVGVAGGRR